MPRRALAFTVPVLLIALLALAAGCGGGGADGEATPGVSPTATTAALATTTVTATATSAAAATETRAPDIRQEDLTGQPGLQQLLALSGGRVDASRITYVDLTGEGAEEAVVPVSSGGEGGDIAVFVFGYGAGGLEELLRVMPKNGSLRGNIIDGVLTIIEPVFGPGDPLCCPSHMRTTTYRWDGSNLVVAHQETVPAAGN